jgi:hypothetical protein
MKRIITMLIVLGPLFFSIESQAGVTNTSNKTEVSMTKAEKKMQVKKLSARLEEIHRLATTTTLSATEKNQYRQEVQSIKQQLEKMEGVYLYLSLTAILIIILLIILL